MVKLFVENGASLLKPRRDGLNILHLCCCSNDIHTLDYAIKKKETKSIDMLTEEGYSPAHHAALRSFMDILNLLIENGADLSKKNGDDSSCYDEVLK
jgi:ankyrin repeat protein